MKALLKIVLICVSVLLIQCQSTLVRNNGRFSLRTVANSKMVLDSSGYLYDPMDRSCDGYPRLSVQTMPGTCLGMVLPRDRANDPATDRSFIKPRTILQIPNTPNFLVVDMGGWQPNNGRLFLLTPENSGQYTLKLLKFGLNNPHGLALGPDGAFYVGEKTQVSRFRLQQNQITHWQLVIGDFARKEGYMHPLSQFVFDPRNGDLFINAGSASDHCFASGAGAYSFCSESEDQGNGIIMRVDAQMLKNIPVGGVRYYEVTAKGLRNSMAMVVHPSGFLIQGENSRDFPELEEPYEEINVIDLNEGLARHYGWPYCYDFHATSPEFLSKNSKSFVDCQQREAKGAGDYQAPHALMPPHVAPLHMEYYKGSMFANLFGGKLLMSWHGYQSAGHRLVAYDVDPQGRPILQPPSENSQFNFNENDGCSVAKKFDPKGGFTQHAPYTEIISGWSQIKKLRPKGAPVAFTQADDGSLWIVEDRENRVIVRLAKDDDANYQDDCNETKENGKDPLISFLAWRNQILTNPELLTGYQQVQSQIINKNCLGCHGNMKAFDIGDDRFSNLDFLIKNDWISPRSLNKSKFYGAIAHLDGYTPMPPADKDQFFGTPEGQRLNGLLAKWINGLSDDEIESTFGRWTIKETRNIRQKPGTEGAICGQFQAGDIVYGDNRPEKIVTTGKIKWTKMYVIPNHHRLKPKACPVPEDGTYWVAN